MILSSNPRIPRYYYSSPPLLAMQNPREYRSLWFVVYGDSTPASKVVVRIDHDTDDLKKAINEERGRLNCSAISNMLLWKLNTPIPVSKFQKDALDTSFVHFPDPSSDEAFDENGAVQCLNLTDNVFRYWKEHPDKMQLHIIAQGQSAYLDTYARLRTHLWGRNRVNFVSTARNNYSTVDLTSFDLPQLNPRSTKILFIRDEYRLTYKAILEKARRGRSIFLITGQPGTGKTLFLLDLLVYLLQQRIPVALQIDAFEFVLFDYRGVHMYQTNSRCASDIPIDAWTLSDSSAGQQHEPCAAFKHSKAHIIHTSSLASYRWKEWEKQLGATRHIMDVWSLEEFRGLLTTSGLDIQRGVDLFRKYGSNVRAIIDILDTPAKEVTYLTDVRAGASNFATDFSNVLSDLRNLDFGSKASSEIFTLRPNNLVSRQPILRIPTSFLAATLGLALARQAVAQQHAAFTMLSKHPSLRTAAEWLFENYAHVVLSDPNRLPLTIYIPDETEPPSIPPNEMKSGSTALKNIQPPFSFYWRPQESKFEGLDAIIRHGNVVWGLEFRHGVAILGSEQANAESARDSQKLTGTWTNTPIFACVLPMGNLDECLLQKALDEASDNYPEDQSMGLGDPMVESN